MKTICSIGTILALAAAGVAAQTTTDLLDGFDPRDDHPVCTKVEGAFGQRCAAFGQSHQDDSITAQPRTNVLVDLFPVEMPVLGIDDNPVQVQCDRHLGDGR